MERCGAVERAVPWEAMVWHCPLEVPSSPETAARDLEGQVHIPPARCSCGALEARYYMEKVAVLSKTPLP